MVTTRSNGNGTGRHEKEIEHISWIWTILAFLCMTVVPIGVYWCYICVEHNQGHMLLPKSLNSEEIARWWYQDVWARIVTECVPNSSTWTIYLTWLTFQAILFKFAPGPKLKGVPLGPEQKRLEYNINGQFAWFTTLFVAFFLHNTGLFKLTVMKQQFAPLLTVCLIVTCVVVGLIYIYSRITGTTERQTDSVIYDYFMGGLINPRIGDFDIKWFFELRPGIMHWFFTSVGFALCQYEDIGHISTPMLLCVFYHLCFVNACYKGEQCVPVTIDIVYEKFGWMLCFLDIVIVPFIFPLQAYYLYKIGPYEHSTFVTILLFSAHIFAYWLFDTANSQKDYFREEEKAKKSGEPIIPKGFPTLPWDRLENPKYIQTERGTKLLIDGWWAWARHLNYTGDIIMSWTWGFNCLCGPTWSYFPFAYTTYLTPLLLHREVRDDIDCAKKYGADWEKYKKAVPWRLIPYVY